MPTNNQSDSQSSNQAQGGTTMADRASDLKDRAGEMLQGGIDAVKNNPGTTAAILGGVAAAAAAIVNKDKIVEGAGNLRERMGGSGKSDKKA